MLVSQDARIYAKSNVIVYLTIFMYYAIIKSNKIGAYLL